MPSTRALRVPSDGGTRDWSTASTVDRQFIDMLEVFRNSGGLAPVAEVTAWFRDHRGPTGPELQDWIHQRTVLCLTWQSQLWLPWFQFNRATCAPHVQVCTVLRELQAVHAPWEACRWFTLPNPWLEQGLPVDRVLHDLSGVLHAATADRLIANGQGDRAA
jgi:hypothetical protein